MRIVLTLASLILLAGLAQAQVVSPQSSASTSIPVAKISPAEKRALQLDKLLGRLHGGQKSADVSKTEADIWALWSQNDSATAVVLLRQASAAIDARDFDPAEQMLSQLIETYPDFAEGWNRRGALYYLMKRYDAALIDIDHALSLEPRNFGALLGKGMVLKAQHKTDAAVTAFNEALQINPHLDAAREAIKVIEKEDPAI